MGNRLARGPLKNWEQAQFLNQMIHSSKFAGVCRLHEEAPAKKCVNRCRISLWLVLPFWQTYLSTSAPGMRNRNKASSSRTVFSFPWLPNAHPQVRTPHSKDFISQSLRTKRTCWKKRPLFWAALADVTKPCQVDQNHEIRHDTCSKWENHRTK